MVTLPGIDLGSFSKASKMSQMCPMRGLSLGLLWWHAAIKSAMACGACMGTKISALVASLVGSFRVQICIANGNAIFKALWRHRHVSSEEGCNAIQLLFDLEKANF